MSAQLGFKEKLAPYVPGGRETSQGDRQKAGEVKNAKNTARKKPRSFE